MTNTTHYHDLNKIQGLHDQSLHKVIFKITQSIIKREEPIFTYSSQSTLKVTQFIIHHNVSQKSLLSALSDAIWEIFQTPNSFSSSSTWQGTQTFSLLPTHWVTTAPRAPAPQPPTTTTPFTYPFLSTSQKMLGWDWQKVSFTRGLLGVAVAR